MRQAWMPRARFEEMIGAGRVEVDGEVVEREQLLSHDGGTARGCRPAKV